jgi:predicted DNA-binding transcriptional regulator YafY
LESSKAGVRRVCHRAHPARYGRPPFPRNAEILIKEAKDILDKRLDEILGSRYSVFSGDQVSWAVLRFTPERALWVASERRHQTQEGKLLDDGSYELRVPYADDRELIMDIMKHSVVEPAKLRQRVAVEFAASRKHYRT